MPAVIRLNHPGWDLAVYHNAIRALHAGHDPYSDAMAVQRLFHSHPELHIGGDPPYSYVYSPITLPVLHLIGSLPPWFSGSAFWLVYLAGFFTTLRVVMQAVEKSERTTFLYLAGVSAFFPCLLASGVILSGNVAYILYALMLLAASYGWRRGSWTWFYLVVLVASCIKAPLLTFLAIPVLSARRQWIPASLTAAAGLALFAIQPRLWPTLFTHYLEAVELQFSYNRDFGGSPAGIFAGVLFDHHIPYAPATYVFYLSYALPVFAVLLHLSRKFLRGSLSLQQWMPVLLVGVILLNPRIIEYDTAPLAIPLALLAWRYLNSITTRHATILIFSIVFVITNAVALYSWDLSKLLQGPLLATLFAAGSWNLVQQNLTERTPPDDQLPTTRKKQPTKIHIASRDGVLTTSG